MSPWIDRMSGRSAWREAGEGPAVIFLHGLGGTRGSWNPQLAALSDARRCIAWDMPGYGSSTRAQPLTYEAIAGRLVELLDVVELEVADLVGLSFGGMHALHTALGHPGRVGRLVLADTSPAFGMDGTRPDDWVAARLAPIEAGETPATMAGAVLDAISALPLQARIRDDLVAAFGRIPVAGFRDAVRCLPTNDIRDRLSNIGNEALVIVGELDEETPVSYASALAAGLPNGRLEVLPGVGHLSPSEAPDRFNALVREFLDRPPTPSGDLS